MASLADDIRNAFAEVTCTELDLSCYEETRLIQNGSEIREVVVTVPVLENKTAQAISEDVDV